MVNGHLCVHMHTLYNIRMCRLQRCSWRLPESDYAGNSFSQRISFLEIIIYETVLCIDWSYCVMRNILALDYCITRDVLCSAQLCYR